MKYFDFLLNAAASFASLGRGVTGRSYRQPRERGRMTGHKTCQLADEKLTPLDVHRRYTENSHIRRRGLDGSLRSNMSNRLREIQLTGR